MKVSLALTLLLGTWANAASIAYDINGDGLADGLLGVGGLGWGLNNGLAYDINGDGLYDGVVGGLGLGLGGVAVDVNADGIADGFLGYNGLVNGAGVVVDNVGPAALYNTGYGGIPVNTLQVENMVDVVAPGINVGSMVTGGELAEFQDGAFPGPGYIVDNYIAEPITQYTAVGGVLPMLPGPNGITPDGHAEFGLPGVPVPMPEIGIPLPEPSDVTAILPTAVSAVPSSIPFAALEVNDINGAIYGLGTPAADFVDTVVTYDVTPNVDGVPVLPAVPDMAAGVAILTDDQIATLLVNHGVDSFRVADMVAQLSAYLTNAFNTGAVAVANGMNSLVNSGAENWQNIANIRNSLGDLIGGIQRDQSTSVKEGLAALLTGAGESQEKTNLLAERLSNLFVNTALSQQALVNAALNNLVKSNIGNMDNADTIITQLTNAFTSNQAVDEAALNDNLNALMAVLAANMPQPVGGAVLNPGVPVGEYVAGASAAAYGNAALDALAADAGLGLNGALVNGGLVTGGILGDAVVANAFDGIAGNEVVVNGGLGLGYNGAIVM